MRKKELAAMPVFASGVMAKCFIRKAPKSLNQKQTMRFIGSIKPYML